MMDGNTVRNMQSDIQLTRKIVYLVGFTIKPITMLGPMNIKPLRFFADIKYMPENSYKFSIRNIHHLSGTNFYAPPLVILATLF